MGETTANQEISEEKLEKLIGEALEDDFTFGAFCYLMERNLDETTIVLDANPEDSEVRKILGERRAYNKILVQLESLRNKALSKSTHR